MATGSNMMDDMVEAFAQAMHRIRAAYGMYTQPESPFKGYEDAMFGLLLAVSEAVQHLGVDEAVFRRRVTARAWVLESDFKGVEVGA